MFTSEDEEAVLKVNAMDDDFKDVHDKLLPRKSQANNENDDNPPSVGEIIDYIGDNPLLGRGLLILGLANSADAVEVTAFGYIINLVVLVDKDENAKLLTDDAFWSGIITAGVLVGMLLGGLVSGYLSDRICRRKMLIISMIINFMGAVLSSTTLLIPNEFQQFWLLTARVVAGLGVGGTIPSVFALTTEIAPSHLRSQAVNTVASLWVLGLSFTAIMALVILSPEAAQVKDFQNGENENILDNQRWPIFAIVAAFPSFLSAILIFMFVFPSAVQMDRLGRKEKAKRILMASVDAKSKHESSWVSWLPGEKGMAPPQVPDGHNLVDLVDSYANAPPCCVDKDWSVFQSLGRISQSDTRGSLFLLAVVWFTFSFAAYGLLGWIAAIFTAVGFDSNPYVPSLLMAFASIPGNFLAIFRTGSKGAKQVLVESLVFTTVSLVVFFFFSDSKPAVIIGSSLFQCFSTAAWDALGGVMSRLFPANIRSFAIGLLASIGRIGGIAASFYNGYIFAEKDADLILLTDAIFVLCGSVAAALLRDPRSVDFD